MGQELKTANLLTVNNRFARMMILNCISLIVSIAISGAWFVMFVVELSIGVSETYWYGYLIMMALFGIGVFSSGYCYQKSEQYCNGCPNPRDNADSSNVITKLATNLMRNSWSNKAGVHSFRTMEIVISYGLFEIFATIVAIFLVVVQIIVIILMAFYTQVLYELGIAICVISIVTLVVSRALIWWSIILLWKNCNNLGREYNEMLAIRNTKEEAEHKLSVAAQKMNADVKHLLAESGFKFFLKYYEQLTKVGVRDVYVDEDYSPTEKTERLKAVKQLIDSGLAVAAAQQILEQFSDFLTDKEKELALRIAGLQN